MSLSLHSPLPAPARLTLGSSLPRLVLGCILLTASAKLQVPFFPVPMTLQVAAVMALAAAYGMRLGSATVFSYLALGAAGLPVFAGTPEKGIGLAYMLGGTGGYLVGFLFAATLVGYAADRLPKWALWPAMAAGLAGIYGLGLAWLAGFVPADKLLAYGLWPFLAGDLLKITLAALLVIGLPPRLMRLIRGSGADA